MSQRDKTIVTNDSRKNNGFRVDQIDHIELFVPDRHQAAEWYRRVLGLEIVREYEHWAEDPEGPLMISSAAGNTKLALFQGMPQGPRETAGFHLVAFRVGAAAFNSFLDRLPNLDLVNHRGQSVTMDSVVDHAAAFSIYFCDRGEDPLPASRTSHQRRSVCQLVLQTLRRLHDRRSKQPIVARDC